MSSSNASLRLHPALEGVFAKVVPIALEIPEGNNWQATFSQRLIEEGLDFIASHLANCDCCRCALDGEMPPKISKIVKKTDYQTKSHNGVCTCGGKTATTIDGTDDQAALESPAKVASPKEVDGEPTHPCTELRKTVGDHQWHLFTRHRPDYRQALALRTDGRLLCMPASQYLAAKRNEPEYLEALIAGTGVQRTERDSGGYEEQRPFKRCSDCGRFCDAKRMARRVKEEPRYPLQANDSDQNRLDHSSHKRFEKAELPGRDAPTSLLAVSSSEYTNTKTVFRIDPPCYCQPCSNDMWLAEGFLAKISIQDASSLVGRLVAEIKDCSDVIQKLLHTHEHTLRRRWRKKKPSQREAIMKRMSGGKHMSYRGLATLLGDFWPRKRPGRLPLKCEVGTFSLGYLSEDIVEDPDLLFDHLTARSRQHPRHFFLTDMVKLRNGLRLAGICDKYCPGSFSIAEDSYGSWAEWDDGKIHRFQTVAATLAVGTFLVQCHIYEVFTETIEELSKELKGMEPCTRPKDEVLSSPSAVTNTLPTLYDGVSIFWEAEPPRCQLSDVLEIAEKKLAGAIDDLQLVRSDNKVFLQRINACKDFRRYSRMGGLPQNSDEPLFVQHILGEPHDRVVMWVLVKEQLLKVIAASSHKETQQSQYADQFRTLLCMMKQRAEWILFFVIELCMVDVDSSALVPSTLTNKSIPNYQWLIRYFFGYLISGSQPLNSAFIRKCVVEQAEDFGDINLVIKEWIDEALVINRVLEMLMVVEPMIDVHETELPSHHDAIWSVMFGAPTMELRAMSIQGRCAGALMNFEELDVYRLPHRSHHRDRAWDLRYLEAKNQLRETWEDYFDGLRNWVFLNKDIIPSEKVEVAALFEGIEDISEPPAVVLPERKVHPGTPLASRVKHVESTSSDSIPHHFGPDTPTVRKVTKRKLANEARKRSKDEEKVTTQRAALAMETDGPAEGQHDALLDENDDADVEDALEENDEEPDEGQVHIQIPVKSRYLSVVESLFSNAQEQVANVRWPRFERFMKDAGCSVRYNDGAVTFSGHNVVTGQRVSCVIHRPHPDSTLYAVHLRNNRLHIEAAFGWTEDMFVERRGVDETIAV